MPSTLHDILHYETLTGIVQDIRGGVPTQSIPPAFFNVTRRVSGDAIKYYTVQGTRKTAMIAHRSSESQRRQLTGLQEKTAKAIFVHEHLFHDVDVLNNLRNENDPMRQELGRQEVQRQARESRQLIDNTRAAAIASALLRGKINYTVGQGILGTGGTEIDFGIPAGNLNQLDVLGDGAIIDVSWDTATASIVTQVQKLKNAALRKTGYPLRHAFVGDDILGHLLTNNEVKEFLKANTQLAAGFTARTIPDGFLGLTWHQAGEFFFEDPDGDYVTPLADDGIVFTPDPSPDWWDVIEGTYEVPTDLGGVAADAVGALNQFATVSGRFNYARISADPSGIKHNYGDTFLPVIKVPNAMFIADVVFST